MQNDQTADQGLMFSSVRSEAGKARIKAAVNGFQSRPDKVQPSIPEQIAAVKAGYDLRSISPQDIDEMFNALVQLGQPVSAPMLLLNSMGAQFRGRLAQITGSDFDGAKPLDLVTVAQMQIHRARKQGGNSTGWEAFLSFLAPHQSEPVQAAPTQATPTQATPTQATPTQAAPTPAVPPTAPLGHMAQLAQQAQTRPH